MEEDLKTSSVLQYSDVHHRKIRKTELGKSTWIKLQEAVKSGDNDEALELAKYLIPEGKAMHDLFCDWMYADVDYMARKYGEEEVPKILRYAYSVIGKAAHKNTAKSTPKDLVYKFAEFCRAHRSGPGEVGNVEITEEEDRYVLTIDPCGSGGRLRREGEIDGTPPRTEPPYNLGSTSKGYPWSWGKAGVTYYCIHCCVWGELIPIEALGYPVRVTEYNDDPKGPCKCYFYKKPELIPEEYFTRVGKVKDPSKFIKG